MARKLGIPHGASVLLVGLILVGASGCASGRGSKDVNTRASVAPSSQPAAGIAAESSRLSGFNPTGVSPSNVNSSAVYPTAAEDAGDPTPPRSTYSSGASSRSGCNSGSCGHCGG